jgi:hypothetical protein
MSTPIFLASSAAGHFGPRTGRDPLEHGSSFQQAVDHDLSALALLVDVLELRAAHTRIVHGPLDQFADALEAAPLTFGFTREAIGEIPCRPQTSRAWRPFFEPAQTLLNPVDTCAAGSIVSLSGCWNRLSMTTWSLVASM